MASDLFREWRKFSGPITERSEAKSKQSWIALKIALIKQRLLSEIKPVLHKYFEVLEQKSSS